MSTLSLKSLQLLVIENILIFYLLCIFYDKCKLSPLLRNVKKKIDNYLYQSQSEMSSIKSHIMNLKKVRSRFAFSAHVYGTLLYLSLVIMRRMS